MALQTPLTQEQLIAQALGSAQASGMNVGMPGAGGMPAPSGMPGAPAMDPQLIAQALASNEVPVNPAEGLFDPGSFGDFLNRVKQWKECTMMGRTDCGPQPTRENPLPQPEMSRPKPVV